MKQRKLIPAGLERVIDAEIVQKRRKASKARKKDSMGRLVLLSKALIARDLGRYLHNLHNGLDGLASLP